MHAGVKRQKCIWIQIIQERGTSQTWPQHLLHDQTDVQQLSTTQLHSKLFEANHDGELVDHVSL